MTTCEDCGQPMTDEEVEYYEVHCDRCERIWCARLTLWMVGKSDNAEFDLKFSTPDAQRR